LPPPDQDGIDGRCRLVHSMNPIVREDLEFIASTALPWDALEGRTILIAGASGFLPAYMVETILFLNDHRFGRRATILALVRNGERALSRFAAYSNRPDLEYIVQDVCDPLIFKMPPDIIVHAASQASPKYYGQDPIGTLRPNIWGTQNLLDAAKHYQVQDFLFFSSAEVYGDLTPMDMPVRENSYGSMDPLNVRSTYGESKRMGETLCASWHRQYGLPFRIVRPFHTYGPGMRLDDGRVFADFVSDVVHDRDIVMNSSGSAIRAFTYLADATVGFFTVLLNGEHSQAYNIGDPKGESSILGLAQLLLDLFPEKRLRIIESAATQPGYVKSTVDCLVPDIGKVASLGWTPRYSLRQGLQRTVLSFGRG
jgi:UDP-glucuronate decarboxylase